MSGAALFGPAVLLALASLHFWTQRHDTQAQGDVRYGFHLLRGSRSPGSRMMTVWAVTAGSFAVLVTVTGVAQLVA